MTIYQSGEHEWLTLNSDHFPSRAPFNAEILMEDSVAHWRIAPNNVENHAALMDVQNIEQIACFQSNIEKFISTVKLPFGLICKQQVCGLGQLRRHPHLQTSPVDKRHTV